MGANDTAYFATPMLETDRLSFTRAVLTLSLPAPISIFLIMIASGARSSRVRRGINLKESKKSIESVLYSTLFQTPFLEKVVEMIFFQSEKGEAIKRAGVYAPAGNYKIVKC